MRIEPEITLYVETPFKRKCPSSAFYVLVQLQQRKSNEYLGQAEEGSFEYGGALGSDGVGIQITMNYNEREEKNAKIVR